ncbi:aquaporin Z [Promicromonospora umidemergens]|uniref:Aquaporin Z n=1 Tax=Promicromonospora umidemergens TaxID=629679 RepID=A0ABP8Y7X3_9MICO|nr:aquaporin [Promicromonospora umidemergens]MCP2282511.1 aquaporin Z [Promicromonospora umidemergens]
MSQDLAATRGVSEVEERSSSLLSRLLAETFGTFLLTLVIVGMLVYSPLNSAQALGVALGGAFAYIAAAAAVGRVSGAHFNPAISLGTWLGGRISVSSMFSYWGAQLVGALLAGAVLFATFPRTLVTLLQGQNPALQNVSDVFDSAVNGFSEKSPLYLQTQGGAQFDWLPALLVEIIISAVLVGVYLGAYDSRRRTGYGPVAVGSAIAALTLVSWFVTNAGMNPARSTAAAIFANDWGSDGSGRQLWLFWLAPLIGAALAALFYRAFASEAEELEDLDEDDDDDDEDEDEDDEKAPAAVASTPVASTPEAGTADVKTAEAESTEPASTVAGPDAAVEPKTAKKTGDKA